MWFILCVITDNEQVIFIVHFFRNWIEVATARPETVFADVALAVHPNDERHSYLIGKYVYHPLFPDRILPIIGDEAVLPNKGTGSLLVQKFFFVLFFLLSDFV